MKSYSLWVFIIGLPILVLAGSVLYFPHSAVQIFKLHWVCWLILAIMLCGRRRKLRLAANELEPPRYTRLSWLLQIFTLQLSITAVFLGICACCGQSAPVNINPQAGLFAQSMAQFLIAQGLFPWGFYAVSAILMGDYAYRRREDAYWGTVLGPLISNTLVKVSINFIARALTMTAYGLTICLISLLWASMVTAFPIITGFYLTPLLLTIILLLLSFTKIFRRNVNKAVGKDIPLAPGLFLWTIFLAAAIWLLNGFLSPWTHIAMAAPILLSHWLNHPWQDLWLIFANSFWLLWAPIMGITLARISRGYTIAEVIGAIFILPLAVALVFYLSRKIQWDMIPLYAGLIAGAGLLILFILTLRKKSTPSFILSYLPRQDHYKFRSYRRTLVRVTQCAVGILFIYLPGGVYATNFIIFSLALCAMAIILIFIINLGDPSRK